MWSSNKLKKNKELLLQRACFTEREKYCFWILTILQALCSTFYLHDKVDVFHVGWFSKGKLYLSTYMMKSPFQTIPSVLQVVIKVLGESVKVEPDFLTFTCTKDVIYEFNKFFLAFFVTSSHNCGAFRVQNLFWASGVYSYKTHWLTLAMKPCLSFAWSSCATAVSMS